MPEQEARDDEREALATLREMRAESGRHSAHEVAALDLAIDALTRKRPEPEITDETADRALGAWFNAALNAGENIAVSARLLERNRPRMRAALAAALQVPVGEGE